ncbi:MAG: RHS repeat-associated core domain-containing protein [Planctomycetota bacterium]
MGSRNRINASLGKSLVLLAFASGHAIAAQSDPPALVRPAAIDSPSNLAAIAPNTRSRSSIGVPDSNVFGTNRWAGSTLLAGQSLGANSSGLPLEEPPTAPSDRSRWRSQLTTFSEFSIDTLRPTYNPVPPLPPQTQDTVLCSCNDAIDSVGQAWDTGVRKIRRRDITVGPFDRVPFLVLDGGPADSLTLWSPSYVPPGPGQPPNTSIQFTSTDPALFATVADDACDADGISVTLLDGGFTRIETYKDGYLRGVRGLGEAGSGFLGFDLTANFCGRAETEFQLTCFELAMLDAEWSVYAIASEAAERYSLIDSIDQSVTSLASAALLSGLGLLGTYESGVALRSPPPCECVHYTGISFVLEGFADGMCTYALKPELVTNRFGGSGNDPRLVDTMTLQFPADTGNVSFFGSEALGQMSFQYAVNNILPEGETPLESEARLAIFTTSYQELDTTSSAEVSTEWLTENLSYYYYWPENSGEDDYDAGAAGLMRFVLDTQSVINYKLDWGDLVPVNIYDVDPSIAPAPVSLLAKDGDATSIDPVKVSRLLDAYAARAYRWENNERLKAIAMRGGFTPAEVAQHAGSGQNALNSFGTALQSKAIEFSYTDYPLPATLAEWPSPSLNREDRLYEAYRMVYRAVTATQFTNETVDGEQVNIDGRTETIYYNIFSLPIAKRLEVPSEGGGAPDIRWWYYEYGTPSTHSAPGEEHLWGRLTREAGPEAILDFDPQTGVVTPRTTPLAGMSELGAVKVFDYFEEDVHDDPALAGYTQFDGFLKSEAIVVGWNQGNTPVTVREYTYETESLYDGDTYDPDVGYATHVTNLTSETIYPDATTGGSGTGQTTAVEYYYGPTNFLTGSTWDLADFATSLIFKRTIHPPESTATHGEEGVRRSFVEIYEPSSAGSRPLAVIDEIGRLSLYGYDRYGRRTHEIEDADFALFQQTGQDGWYDHEAFVPLRVMIEDNLIGLAIDRQYPDPATPGSDEQNLRDQLDLDSYMGGQRERRRLLHSYNRDGQLVETLLADPVIRLVDTRGEDVAAYGKLTPAYVRPATWSSTLRSSAGDTIAQAVADLRADAVRVFDTWHFGGFQESPLGAKNTDGEVPTDPRQIVGPMAFEQITPDRKPRLSGLMRGDRGVSSPATQAWWGAIERYPDQQGALLSYTNFRYDIFGRPLNTQRFHSIPGGTTPADPPEARNPPIFINLDYSANSLVDRVFYDNYITGSTGSQQLVDTGGKPTLVVQADGTARFHEFDNNRRVEAIWYAGFDDIFGTFSTPVRLESYEYDLIGRKITERLHVSGGTTPPGVEGDETTDRRTDYVYDSRGRTFQMIRWEDKADDVTPGIGFVTEMEYDNLDRPIVERRYRLDESTGTTTPISRTLTYYDERSRVYRRQFFGATEGLATPEGDSDGNGIADAEEVVLEELNWFDAVGRVVKTGAAGDGDVYTKFKYDGLDRETRRARTSPELSGSDDPASLTGDLVLSMTDSAYNLAGDLLTVTTYRRHSDEALGRAQITLPALGALDASTSRMTYMTYYYDGGGRLVASVNRGDNAYSPFSRPLNDVNNLFNRVPEPGADVYVTLQSYDAWGRVSQVFEATEAMEPLPQTFADRAALGIRSYTEYDSLDRVVREIQNYDPAKNNGNPTIDAGVEYNFTTTYIYFPGWFKQGGQLKEVRAQYPTGGGGITSNVTSYQYQTTTPEGERYDLLSRVTNPDGSFESYQYNRVGELTKRRDARGVETLTTYDRLGRATEVAVDLSAPPAILDTTVAKITHSFDDRGHLFRSSSIDSSGMTLNEIEYRYDHRNQVSRMFQNAFGPVQVDAFDDPTGRTRAVSFTRGSATKTNRHRLTGVRYPSQHEPVGGGANPQNRPTLVRTYGSSSGRAGLRSSPTSLTLYTGNGTSDTAFGLASYEFYGDETAVKTTLNPDGAGFEHDLYVHDVALQPVVPGAIFHPDTIDRFGRVLTYDWTHGDGTYDAEGDPTNRALFSEQTTYDRWDNRTSVHERSADPFPSFALPGGPTVVTPNSNPLHARMDRNRFYSYDRAQRLTDVGTLSRSLAPAESPPAASISWALDTFGNWFTDPRIGTVQERKHTEMNELIEILDGLGGPIDRKFMYDASGNLIMEEDGGMNLVRDYRYDAWNRLTEVKVPDPQSPGQLITIASYDYNPANQLILQTYDANKDGVEEEQRELIYNDAWQLLEERVVADPGPSGREIERKQNFWGIRSLDDLIASRRDLEASGGTSPPNNLWREVAAGERYYFYLTDQLGSIRKVLNPEFDDVELSIDYDDYGQFTWHSGAAALALPYDVISQADSAVVANAVTGVIADDRVEAFVFPGDVASQLDANRFADLFFLGVPDESPGRDLASANRFGFAGYLWDPVLQMYHVRNRVYSADLGRWIQRDPAGTVDGHNLYQYSRSNPTTLVDPYGLFATQPDMYGGLGPTSDPSDPFYMVDQYIMADAAQKLAFLENLQYGAANAAATVLQGAIIGLEFIPGIGAAVGAATTMYDLWTGEISDEEAAILLVAGAIPGGRAAARLARSQIKAVTTALKKIGTSQEYIADAYSTSRNARRTANRSRTSGRLLPCACFSAGTPVNTESGDISIEDIVLGDGLLASPDPVDGLVWGTHAGESDGGSTDGNVEAETTESDDDAGSIPFPTVPEASDPPHPLFPEAA